MCAGRARSTACSTDGGDPPGVVHEGEAQCRAVPRGRRTCSQGSVTLVGGVRDVPVATQPGSDGGRCPGTSAARRSGSRTGVDRSAGSVGDDRGRGPAAGPCAGRRCGPWGRRCSQCPLLSAVPGALCVDPGSSLAEWTRAGGIARLPPAPRQDVGLSISARPCVECRDCRPRARPGGIPAIRGAQTSRAGGAGRGSLAA